MMRHRILRGARLRLGISQHEMANLVGTSQASISRWEDATVPVPDAALDLVERVLRARLDLEQAFADRVLRDLDPVDHPMYDIALAMKFVGDRNG